MYNVVYPDLSCQLFVIADMEVLDYYHFSRGGEGTDGTENGQGAYVMGSLDPTTNQGRLENSPAIMT